MMVRALFTLAMFTTAAACAQTQQTDDAQTTQQVQTQQVEQPEVATSSCWVRGDAAALAQRESALDSATVTVGGRSIKVCYGRPQMRGRTIMGGLVPYGQPWRLGANEATTIHMPSAGTIAGVPVQAGSYSLYVVPNQSEWQVAINRNAQRWGVPINQAVRGNDVGTGTVVPEAISQPVEALTIRFDNATAQGASLVVEWERTRIRIPVTLTPQ
jgi:hypothetical protein